MNAVFDIDTRSADQAESIGYTTRNLLTRRASTATREVAKRNTRRGEAQRVGIRAQNLRMHQVSCVKSVERLQHSGHFLYQVRTVQGIKNIFHCLLSGTITPGVNLCSLTDKAPSKRLVVLLRLPTHTITPAAATQASASAGVAGTPSHLH